MEYLVSSINRLKDKTIEQLEQVKIREKGEKGKYLKKKVLKEEEKDISE